MIDHGRIVQLGTPQEVWQQPSSRFVAELFGDTDAIEGRYEADKIMTAFGELTPQDQLQDGAMCDVIMQPGAATISNAASANGVSVEDVRYLGTHYQIVVRAGEQRLRVQSTDQPTVNIGDPVHIRFDSTKVLLYCRDQ